MRSAALALAWELWRKNRWGFLGLLLLLLACGLFSGHAKRLQAQVVDLERRNPNQVILFAQELLSTAGGELVPQNIRVTQARTVLFEHLVSPGQTLHIEALFSDLPQLAIHLTAPNVA